MINTKRLMQSLSSLDQEILAKMHDELFDYWFEHLQDCEPRFESDTEEQWRNRVQYKTEQQVYEAIGRIVCRG